MGDDEYAFVGGGSLKLKGVKGSKVDKRKRHKTKTQAIAPNDQPVDEEKSQSIDDTQQQQGEPADQPTAEDVTDDSNQEPSTKQNHRDDANVGVVRKTAAELRHEERRRKMLNDRLKREGNKTHKERVEELNKYLSSLSEHHDMPRIGPG